MNSIKVSVIIPIYNAEQYLRSCLDSVLSQSIHDLEVLCTDDGSIDGSFDILQEYARKDKRVCVFSQVNSGSGPARNRSLSNAHGEYVVFMDSDDFYPSEDTLQNLYDIAQKHECSVVAGYRSMLTEKGLNADKNDPLYALVQKYPEGKVLKYRDLQFDFNYQCYMFRRSLLTENNITFPDYLRCQDPPFFVRSMITASNFYLAPFSSYVYRWGHQNIRWTKRKVNDLIKAHIELLHLSRAAELHTLHQSVANRLEKRYKNIIVSGFDCENLELFALMIYANSKTNFDWIAQNGANKPTSKIFDSVQELKSKLVNLLIYSGGISRNGLKDVVYSICDYYQTLPNADTCALNDALSFVLSQLYCIKCPSFIRLQLGKYLTESGYEELSACCNQTKNEVREAIYLLDAAYSANKFYNRLESIRKDNLQNCCCILDSTNSDNTLVSVIVPIYNEERHISECLESLLNQTCKGIEIICVDDGSTDDSLAIVMEYAKKYRNITVIKQTNSGLSAARNTGMRYAKGRYIHFLDSDDSMKADSYEILLEKAVTNNLDMLFFDAESFYEDERLKEEFPWYETGYHSKSIGDSIIDGREYLSKVIIEKDFRFSACMYIVSRNFLERNQLKFPEGIVHEDNYFTLASALLSERTSHITEPLYNRRVCRGSLTIRSKSFRHAYGYFYSYCALRNFIDNSSIEQYLKDIASLKLMEILKNAQWQYKNICDKKERLFYLSLPSAEAEQFYLMVVNPVEEMEAYTYKVGKSLSKNFPTNMAKAPITQSAAHQKKDNKYVSTWRMRWIRFAHCYSDNGIIYTIKHTVKRVLFKLKKKLRI